LKNLDHTNQFAIFFIISMQSVKYYNYFLRLNFENTLIPKKTAQNAAAAPITATVISTGSGIAETDSGDGIVAA
jgi:hypothetical protein